MLLSPLRQAAAAVADDLPPGGCVCEGFVCEHSCARLKPFETSAPMHCDDYELNSRLNYAITTCAISFERIVPALELLGLRAVSTTDHYGFKVNALASRIAARVFTS
jgi:hypothetical protein